MTSLYIPLVTTINCSQLTSGCGALLFLSIPLITYTNNTCSSMSAITTVSYPSLTSAFADGYGWVVFRNSSTISSITISGCAVISDYAFWNTPALSYVDLSSCTNLGSTTGDNNVFGYSSGRTMTIKIPHAIESDGDIVYAKANNTVTIIYSD